VPLDALRHDTDPKTTRLTRVPPVANLRASASCERDVVLSVLDNGDVTFSRDQPGVHAVLPSWRNPGATHDRQQ
jgi:hypothetical protein